MTLRIIRVALSRDADVLTARQRARQLAALFGLDRQAETRFATAVSEIARNAIEHGGGGSAEFSLVGATPPQLLEARIRDTGPGVKDLAAARAGQSSVRGGLGVGLAGAERLVDQFTIDSTSRGTVVTLATLLPDNARLFDGVQIQRIADELARAAPEGVTDELKRQNRELLVSLEEQRRQRDALAIVNRELEDTNRGVVALYAELDEKAEHLKRADEIKTRFLSNMSHEFRTPLNSILALCRFLEVKTDGPLTLEQERQIGFIRKSAESLSELVEDLLDLAKVAAGKTVIRPSEFEVANLFGALRGMLRPLLVNARVDLVFESAENLPTIYGDESKVSQIVRNFISNALKFTERGEVRVSASTDAEKGTITICVADTGIGIPAEHHTRIFDEFSQIDSPIQRKVKGTGLGLPLAKRLAELMRGEVHLKSSPGKGATFSVTLPLVYREGAAAETEKPIMIDPERIPVLAVEDNPADLAVIAASLRNTSYQLVEATTLAQARRLVVSVQPRALLLDIMIGDEQSWKLVSEIKHAPEMAGVPVIVISTVDDPAKAAALGADAWTRKPLRREWLVETLDALVRNRKSTRILIIDDDEVSRYVIRQYLSGTDASIIEASGGTAGIASALENKPDLILLDLRMPDRDGLLVLDDLASDPRTAEVPVAIVTSGTVSDGERKRLKRARAILQKSDMSATLLARLLGELNMKEPRP